MREKDKKRIKDSFLGENMDAQHERITNKDFFKSLLNINASLEIKVAIDYNHYSRHLISEGRGGKIVDYCFDRGAAITYKESSFWSTPTGLAISLGKAFVISTG